MERNTAPVSAGKLQPTNLALANSCLVHKNSETTEALLITAAVHSKLACQ